MQAALDGKEIEKLGKEWSLVLCAPQDTIFAWGEYDYRIKPEPIEFWVNIFDEFNGAYAYETKAKALNGASIPPIKTIKVREVLE